MKFFRQLRALFRREKLDAEMAEEMRTHLELHAAENEKRGMSADAARYAAQRAFGGVEQIKERARDERGWVCLEQFAQDVRHGLRALRKNPLFTGVAVVTLALGIGANTAMFSVLDAVLLHPLPFPDSGKLVAVWERQPETGAHNVVSSGVYLDWQEQNSAFEAIGAFTGIGATLRGDSAPQQATGTRITPGLLNVLRVQPMLGRGFRDEATAEAGGREIIISYSLWQTRYGGRADIVGTAMNLDDTPMTIVGVMPASFEFPTRNNDFWLALRFNAGDRESRKTHTWRVLARLKPGVNASAAQAAMEVVTHRIAAAHPEFMSGWGVDVVSYHDDLVGNVRPTILLLGGMVALVLLVACANVANLMLARSAGRQRELAIRGALGAGRGRIVRQLLTESALLAGLGAAAGLLFATWAMPFLAALAPAQLPGLVAPHLNASALGFAALALLVATAIVGLAPAWWLSRMDLRTFLSGGRAESGSVVLARTRGILLVTQLALATVLLIGAGLLLRSMANLHRVDFGFDPNNLIAGTVNLPRTRYDTVAKQAAFYEQLRGRLETIAGVQAVAGISDPPLAGSSTYSFVIAGRPRPGPNPRENPVEVRGVTPNYFETVKLPVVAGRPFADADRAEGPTVIVVNRAFAKLHFPAGDAVGQRLSNVGQGGPWMEIVGVVGDIKDDGLDQPAAPAIYVPYVQKVDVNLSSLTAVVRTAGDPELAREEIRRAFLAVDPELPLRRLATMPAIYAGRLAQRDFVTRLTLGFAVLTLTLGVIGVYGVISYSVAQRRREFGVCLALGASRWDIVGRVMRGGARLVAIGALLGAAGAAGLARFLGTLLFEIQPADPATFAGVLATLGTVSLIALWLPARQAAGTDPMIALRSE
ncbi:MAG TPA: ABC transporter permease [Opitutaceae bacterium]|nr:ABC transporter permease [Opitutaceae bacterium]